MIRGNRKTLQLSTKPTMNVPARMKENRLKNQINAPGFTPVHLHPVLQLGEAAVEVGGCEVVGNVEDLGHRLHPVGFHHTAPLRQDFMGLF